MCDMLHTPLKKERGGGVGREREEVGKLRQEDREERENDNNVLYK